MNITVYLGSAHGNDEKYTQGVRELGTWIGSSGHNLIYGGSAIGLMGEIAESVLRAGGEVTGVEPRFFVENCLQHDGITELCVTETMAERKAEMIRRGDAFIAYPGGTGTLEEIAEVMSMIRLEHMDAPCILYNLDGFYDPLRELLERMAVCGFIDRDSLDKIKFADNITQIEDILGTTDTECDRRMTGMTAVLGGKRG